MLEEQRQQEISSEMRKENKIQRLRLKGNTVLHQKALKDTQVTGFFKNRMYEHIEAKTLKSKKAVLDGVHQSFDQREV